MGAHRHNPFARNNIVGTRPLVVRDMHGRELLPGDTVVIPGMPLPQFVIGQIAPNLHPGAPPNTARVLVQFQALFQVGIGQNVGEFLLVRTGEENGLAKAEGGEAPAAGAEASEAPTDAPAPPDGPRLVSTE